MNDNIDLTGWTLVGTIGVDSGQMMLADPCYLNQWGGGDFTSIGENKPPSGAFDYDGACLATTADKAGILGRGLGAVCSTGYGDGSYGVYIKTSDEGAWGERVAAMMIVFIGDEDEEECCEECGSTDVISSDEHICFDCEAERYCDCGNEKDPAWSQCDECDERDAEEAEAEEVGV